MLKLTRRLGEILIIRPQDDLAPDTPVGEVFSGPIRIQIGRMWANQVRLGIDAPCSLKVLREEIADKEPRARTSRRALRRTR